MVILAIPFQHLAATLSSLTGFGGKIVISPVNPIGRKEHFFFVLPEDLWPSSVQRLLPQGTRVCTAFNNIAADSGRPSMPPRLFRCCLRG